MIKAVFIPVFSLCYRLFRPWFIAKKKKNASQKGDSFDFENVISVGDAMLRKVDAWIGGFVFSFGIPKNLEVSLFDLKFPSPVTFAAFKGDMSILEIWMRIGMGGGLVKTITSDVREGNARPRIAEVVVSGVPGFLNALGLPGKGVHGLVEQLKSTRLFAYGRPLGFSIGGKDAAEFKSNFDVLHQYLESQPFRSYFYELNVSCPNVMHGKDLTESPDVLLEIVTYMRSKTMAVIGIKLSPDDPNDKLLKLASVAVETEKVYINIGNTTYRTCEQVGLEKEAVSVGGGGFSGPALFERTLEMVQLLEPLKIPIIATGGVTTSEDVKVLLSQGATLVGLASAIMRDIYCIPKINRALSRRT